MNTIALGDTTATLTPYLLKKGYAKGAVIVCPGGAYWGLADYEKAPVAEAFNKAGYHAYVLTYRIGNEINLGTKPLYDACTAIAYVRNQAGALNIPEDTIAICGFSAGGHLAASTAIYWKTPDFFGGTLHPMDYRPDGTILCYPVISDDYPHQQSFINLAGRETTDYSAFSLEKLVSEDTPPAFLWHTANDGSVRVENSLLYAQQLAKYNIPFELHVFPRGPHGIGLATKESGARAVDPYIARWIDWAVSWLDALFL